MRASFVALTLVSPALLCAQAVGPKTTADLQLLHRQAECAYTTGNLKFFESYLANDYVLVRSGESPIPRAQALVRMRDSFQATRATRVTIKLKNLSAAGSQVTAIREITFSGMTTGNRPVRIDQRSTARVTFAKRNGQWQLARQVVLGTTSKIPAGNQLVAPTAVRISNPYFTRTASARASAGNA